MSNRDSYSDFLLVCPLSAVHACPTGVPSRPHSLGDWIESGEGAQTRQGAGVRTSESAQRIWEGACVRRAGVFVSAAR